MSVDPYGMHSAGYASARRPDPRIAARIRAALAGCTSIVNVGAGTGSYEPGDMDVVAVEPSGSMLSQRPRNGVAVVQGRAERLPLRDGSVDAALAVLTLHHWKNPLQGLNECLRVCRRRIVLLTFDAATGADFWLTRDYLPAIRAWDLERFPTLERLREWLGPLVIEPIAIPFDCVDGFLGAYWRRPRAYLDARVRAGMSCFASMAPQEEGLERLRCDLESGAWKQRYGHLLTSPELDIGYRLLVYSVA